MKNTWQKFKAGLFTRAQFITGVIIFMLTCSSVLFAYETAVTLNIFSAGQKISAADVNENFDKVNDQLAKLRENKKMVFGLMADQTFNSGVTSLSFDSVYYDRLGHGYGSDLLTSNYFTIQESGVYEFSYSVRMNSTSGGTLNILKNGLPFTSQYFSASSNYVPVSRNFLDSGAVISFAKNGWEQFTVDASRTRIIIEKID
jgi:hypothetical protein